jgi:hypothetical protein
MKKLVILFTLSLFFAGGAICQTEKDPFGELENGVSLNYLPQEIIHSVIIEATYDGDKKHQIELMPLPLTLTVK